MSKGKYSKNQGFNVRPLVLVLAVALLIGATIGGTVAWLTASTETVENTFTVGDVGLTLVESPITVAEDGTVSYGNPAEGVENKYPMVPGTTYKKDPVVTVEAGSEDCWVFVQFDKGSKTDDYITYTADWTGWTQGTGTDGIPVNVWYRHVAKTATDTERSWHLLTNDTITINAETVTKGTMSDATANSSLKYIAYAIQSANIGSGTDVQKAAAAWAKIPK